MFQLGFTTVTFRKKTRREVCEIAQKNRIHLLEWGADVHLPPFDPVALQEVLALQKEFQIEANSYGTYYRLGTKNFELWQELLHIASQIGAKTVRIWMGKTEPFFTTETVFSAMVKETQTLCDMAKALGITVAFEFHRGTYNCSGNTTLRFLEAVNRDNVKTYWQPFSIAKDAQNLQTVLPQTVCIHVFHWNAVGKRYALEEGKKRWMAFLRIAKTASTPSTLIMEFVKGDSASQFEQDVATCREWLDALETESGCTDET